MLKNSNILIRTEIFNKDPSCFELFWITDHTRKEDKIKVITIKYFFKKFNINFGHWIASDFLTAKRNIYFILSNIGNVKAALPSVLLIQ